MTFEISTVEETFDQENLEYSDILIIRHARYNSISQVLALDTLSGFLRKDTYSDMNFKNSYKFIEREYTPLLSDGTHEQLIEWLEENNEDLLKKCL